MSFFDQMAARAAGAHAPLRARTPQRYESGVAGVPSTRLDATSPAAPEGLTEVPAVLERPATAGPARTAPRTGATPSLNPSDRPARVHRGAPGLGQRTPARASDTVPAPPVEVPPERPPRAPGTAAPAPAAVAARPRDAGPRQDPPKAPGRAGAPEPRRAGAPAPRHAGPRPDDDALPPRDVRRPPVLAQPVVQPAVQPPQPAHHAAAPGPGAPPPPPDVGQLVRDHVLPALVRRGDLTSQERATPVVPQSTAVPRAAPAPGTVTVATGRVDVRRGGDTGVAPRGAAAPREPQTSVHIDRVVVTRAPAPVPPPAASGPRPRPRVDHSAYLARRRDQR